MRKSAKQICLVLVLAIAAAVIASLSGCATKPTVSQRPDFSSVKRNNTEIGASTERALSDGKQVRTYLRDYRGMDRIDFKVQRLLEGVE